MRITTNINSLLIQRNTKTLHKAISRSLERLASGNQILDARDGAARIALGNRLNAQLRGTRQAILNINQGKSVLATADNAIAAQRDIVLRLRDLAGRASNGTLTTADRAALNTEFQKLIADYKRISTETKYNDQTLLSGSGYSFTLQAGPNKENKIPIAIESYNPEFTTETTTEEYSGSYQAGTSFTASLSDLGSPPFGDAVGDLDNDGDMDYMFNGRSTATNYLYYNNGSGVFSLGTTFSATNTTLFWDFEIADVTGDGVSDIVSSNTSAASDFQVRVNDGSGNFTTNSMTTNLGSTGRRYLELADVDNDNDLDAIVNRQSGEIGIYLNNGTGTFTSAGTFTTGGDSRFLRLGDFDGDGNLDIANKLEDLSLIYIYYGSGTGTFSLGGTIDIGLTSTFGVGDINNDGKDDIAFVNGPISVALGNAGRTWSTIAGGTFDGANTSDTELIDYNHDGYMDLAATNPVTDRLEVQLGDASGTFTPSTSFAVSGTNATSFASGDFNGDDQLDFILQNLGDTLLTFHISGITEIVEIHEWNIETQDNAIEILTELTTVLDNLNEQRALIAAQSSRLESASRFLLSNETTLSEARSQVLDTDYALEVAELVRNQILADIQTALLVQANLSLKLVTKLLE